MAREVDLTKPLSEDDLRYLVDRDRWDDLRTNADNLGIEAPNLPSARGIRAQVPRRQLQNVEGEQAFGRIAKMMHVQRGDEPAPEQPETTGTDYTKLTVPQLKEEMDKRRQQYQSDNDSEGVALMTYQGDAKKVDLVQALQMDDADEAEEDSK